MGARARVARLGSLMRRGCLRIRLLRVSRISAHTREAHGEGYHKTRALGASRTGVLADVCIGEVVRDGVVLAVVLCTSKEWVVSIRRAWAHGCVGRTLSFSGLTGAPKKYCRSVHAQRGGRMSARAKRARLGRGAHSAARPPWTGRRSLAEDGY